jgi:hypothetical protein
MMNVLISEAGLFFLALQSQEALVKQTLLQVCECLPKFIETTSLSTLCKLNFV